MLSTILLLSFFIFSFIYPLCFWISAREPLKNDFHKFHLGLPNVTAGVTLIAMFLMKIPFSIILYAIIAKAFLYGTSQFYWKKPTPNPLAITAASIMGFLAFIKLHNYLLPPSIESIFSWTLAGFIFAASLYAMNLGHWYLNVHGLPLKHLKNASLVLFISLLIRFLWDILYLGTKKTLYQGDTISICRFIGTMDGFLLLIALFFGTLFPLVSMYFVKGTLDVKNTQSATGILYVILTAILIGDITYKYYLIKFSVFM